jgi:hypothetical protein
MCFVMQAHPTIDATRLHSQRMSFGARLLRMAPLLPLLVACGGGNSDGVAPPPPPPARSYLLSATAVQAVAGGQPFCQYTPAGFSVAALAAETDVVAVFVEHYGLPWDEFAAAATRPMRILGRRRCVALPTLRAPPAGVQTVRGLDGRAV